MRLGRKKGLGAQLAGGGWRELSSRVHSVNNATTHALSSSFTFRISAVFSSYCCCYLFPCDASSHK